MIENQWKSIPEIDLCFQAIVENNNRTLTCILDDILITGIRGDILVKISTENIPHDNLVMALQELYLAWS